MLYHFSVQRVAEMFFKFKVYLTVLYFVKTKLDCILLNEALQLENGG